jgi:ABC-2 type transport system ATP-binding protein
LAAVHGLNLSVGPHRTTAFLGQNGAGKSTTIKMLLGMVRPSCGEGTVLGMQITDAEENREMRRKVAYVAETKPLYGYMTVEQTIRFASSFYADWRADVARRLLNEYKLPPQRKVKELSKGMRTKLALLLAFARRPELLILDEPSEGLDPVGIELSCRCLLPRRPRASLFFSLRIKLRKLSALQITFAFSITVASWWMLPSTNCANLIGGLIWFLRLRLPNGSFAL